LADDDIEHIRTRRSAHNRLGFALQLCAFRHPGRLLTSRETIPLNVTKFIAAQIGLRPDDLGSYAETDVTRRRHLIELRALYGYKMFTGRGARDLKAWLEGQAEAARSNEDLACRFVAECRRTLIILPGLSVIERLCADVLVAAERRVEARIAERLDGPMRDKLDALLSESVDGRISRLVWLRQFEVGNNSADVNRLLDRLEFLQGLGLAAAALDGVPPHRITRLRRQGERYFSDDLRDISSDRRLAVLAVCAAEWQAALADVVVETHDRIVGKTWREAKNRCDVGVADAKVALHDTLRAFSGLGAALLEARGDNVPLEAAITLTGGWSALEGLVTTAAQLTDTLAADPLAHVIHGYHRFRRYAPRMLRAINVQAAPVAEPLLAAARGIAGSEDMPGKSENFLRRGSKWHRHLQVQNLDDSRLWEVAVLFHLRDSFRSGDVWLVQSRRYADLKQVLVPIA